MKRMIDSLCLKTMAGKVAAVAVVVCLTCTSCGKDGPTMETKALMTAKTYYDQLCQGDYDSFVDGALHGDSVPSDYRRQMVLGMKMYMERMQKEHKGLVTVDTLRARKGATMYMVDAYLQLTFADSTREEVVVPMLLKDEQWYMR